MNRTSLYLSSAVAAVAAVAVVAWAAPAGVAPVAVAARPASRPSLATLAATVVPVDIKPLPMAAAFSAARTRSIFVKGEQSLVSESGPSVRPPVSASPPVRPQQTMVFNGVTVVGDRPEAMIEDTAAHKVFNVRVGEALAGGRVLDITFDNLDYQGTGKVVHVGIGDNLDGTPAAPGDDAAPTAGATAPADAAGTLGNTVGLSTDDILAKMKRRRQQEQGGK